MCFKTGSFQFSMKKFFPNITKFCIVLNSGCEEQINAILEYIKKCGVHSERIPFDGDMPDEDDRVFYEVSLSKEDSFLVTGNLKHFPKTPKVITAAQMMEILDNEF